MVERLTKARLLVADRRFGTDVVEVAHESLLRQWPALVAWLQADADDLKLVDAIERAAGEWARNDRQDSWLDHRGDRLAAAERVAARGGLSQTAGGGWNCLSASQPRPRGGRAARERGGTRAGTGARLQDASFCKGGRAQRWVFWQQSCWRSLVLPAGNTVQIWRAKWSLIMRTLI